MTSLMICTPKPEFFGW